MSNVKTLLKAEPAAVGTLIASVMPVLVLAQVVHLDDQAIAAVVVAVNAIVAFYVRVSVSPVGGAAQSGTAAESAPPSAA